VSGHGTSFKNQEVEMRGYRENGLPVNNHPNKENKKTLCHLNDQDLHKPKLHIVHTHVPYERKQNVQNGTTKEGLYSQT